MTKTPLTTAALTLAAVLCAPQVHAEQKGEVALFLTIETQPGQRAALVDLWDAHLKTRAAEDKVPIDYIFALDMNDPNAVHIREV
ncbi:MAG: hypothetical protein HRU32_12660 [Rhodobacteraceae bacterium]|nr:hypothetical protein [Paracoccaceae bacterium]